MFHSLRLKLALWYLLIFAIIEVTLLIAGALYRQDAIKRSFDNGLLEWTRGKARVLLASDRPWTTDTLTQVQGADFDFIILAVRDESGRVIAPAAVVNPEALPRPRSQQSQVGFIGTSFATLSQQQASQLLDLEFASRMINLPFRDQAGRVYFLQAAISDDVAHQSAAFMLELFAFALPVGLIGAGAASWLLAGRAVAPIHKMSEAARAVSPRTLDERIQINTPDLEVARLQNELNDALTRLERGYRAQEHFISNISHDLKTPISILLSEAQVLKSRDPSPAEHRAFLASVEEEMRRLGRLVESFLLLVRAQQGEPLARRLRIPLNDIVLESVQHCRSLAVQKDVRLVANLAEPPENGFDPELFGDPDLLRTMFDNLIQNAVRFSSNGETVRIAVGCDDSAATISVRDQGRGIPPEYLDRVFDRFVQVPGDQDRALGTGIGLTIARSVAELHGGTISARNCEGGGCAFEVRLPLS